MTIYNTENIKMPAKAFCNGVEIDHAMTVDTDKGEIVYVPQPARVRKGGCYEVYTRTVTGHVYVVDSEGVKNPDPL